MPLEHIQIATLALVTAGRSATKTLFVTALLSFAPSVQAQTLDETMLFLLFPGHHEQIREAGKPYHLSLPTFPPYRGALEISITFPAKCKARIHYEESGSKFPTNSIFEIDFANAANLDFSGEPFPGATVKGNKALFCRYDVGEPKNCDNEFQAFGFSADLYDKANTYIYRQDVRARYEKAFAYYQRTFCAGRAF